MKKLTAFIFSALKNDGTATGQCRTLVKNNSDRMAHLVRLMGDMPPTAYVHVNHSALSPIRDRPLIMSISSLSDLNGVGNIV